MVKKPRILLQLLLVVVLSTYTFSLFTHPIYSDEASDLQQQIDQKNAELAAKQSTLSSIEAKIKEISGSNNSVSQKIALINAEITKLNDSIAQTDGALNTKIKEIEDKQALLEAKKVEMDKLSTDLYIRSRYRMATFFLSGNDWDTLVKEFFLKQNSISTLKNEVEAINGEFSSLAESRAELETQKATLDAQKKDMDDSYALLAAEKAKLQAELNRQNSTKNNLKAQIGGITKDISQLQQTLLYIRGGGNIDNVDAVSSNATPTTQLKYFVDNAPAGTFGIFSYGTSTHRNGISQWGAWERGQEGQVYTQILSAYYPGSVIRQGLVKTSSYGEEAIATNIPVTGYGSISLEDNYLLGIREVDDGNMNTHNENYLNYLRAQVIAARTYAINYTRNGRNSICTTTSCQVYSTDQLGGLWAQAVRETRGMTLANSSNYIFSSEFSAVTGGWINSNSALGSTGFYDLNTAISGSWQTQAWEARSGVNWFHMNWYQRKVDRKWVSCSTKSQPWLTGEELADILNAYKFWMTSGSGYDGRLVPVDTNTCWGGSDNPYSATELKNLVADPIKRVITAQAIESNGWTTSLNFSVELQSGAITTFNISGTGNTLAFREVYNMRAPGYFSIPQKQSNGGFIHINIVRGVR